MSQIQDYLAECMECNVNQETKSTLCPICMTLKVMKGKWKLAIVWLLKENTLRFSQLQKSIPNITQTYLSKQLKSLEADKLVIRKSYNQVPPKVEYSLSDTGRDFIDVLENMNVWGTAYLLDNVLPLQDQLIDSES